MIAPRRAEALGNRYFGMRHGESKANVAGIIVSRIETDNSGDYALSERGRLQAAQAARRCALGPRTVICSSDFARAWQTAQIVRGQLGAADVIAARELRERSFGELDGSPAAGYARVWAADQAGAAGPADQAREPLAGVEPATAVSGRTLALIADLERRHRGRDILLVSHGDTLAILQAGFLGLDPARHRTLTPFAVAEIRPLLRGPVDADGEARNRCG